MPEKLVKRLHNNSSLGIWECSEPVAELILLARLSPGELVTLHDIRNENRKKQWLGCRIMLRNLLPDLTGGDAIFYDDEGKPHIPGDPLYVSLSHSADLSAVLLSPAYPAGVDIEKVLPRILRVSPYFLSPAELGILGGNLPGPTTAAIAWCIKEAVYKLCGKAGTDLISDIQIESFSYLCNGSGRSWVNLAGNGKSRRLQVCFTLIDGYALAYVTAPVNSI